MGTRPRFETEAKGNSEITDYKFYDFSLDKTFSFVGREIETRIRPNPGLTFNPKLIIQILPTIQEEDDWVMYWEMIVQSTFI